MEGQRVEEGFLGAMERDGGVELSKRDGTTSVEGEMEEVFDDKLPPGLRKELSEERTKKG